MRIAIDESIQLGLECFGSAGEVAAVPAEEMSRERLKGIDALVVRSVTRVDQRLLAGTGVRFVGSVTSGVDHVDLSYLREEGIEFAHAPGCNANSVAEYVVAALLCLHERDVVDLHRATLGVIGVGHVGSRVVEKAGALGLRVVMNDPPLARRGARRAAREGERQGLAPLADVLACDIVSLHVPLTREGTDATLRLLNEERLSHMKPGGVLINTARGDVVDAPALLSAVRGGRLAAPVLDVWPGEPHVSDELISATALGTPHVAGYSLQGRTSGTEVVYDALCRFFAASPAWQAPKSPTRTIMLPVDGPTLLAGAPDIFGAVHEAAKTAYDIEADSAALKRAGSDFQTLRAHHVDHLEFDHVRVGGVSEAHAASAVLGLLGFQI